MRKYGTGSYRDNKIELRKIHTKEDLAIWKQNILAW